MGEPTSLRGQGKGLQEEAHQPTPSRTPVGPGASSFTILGSDLLWTRLLKAGASKETVTRRYHVRTTGHRCLPLCWSPDPGPSPQEHLPVPHNPQASRSLSILLSIPTQALPRPGPALVSLEPSTTASPPPCQLQLPGSQRLGSHSTDVRLLKIESQTLRGFIKRNLKLAFLLACAHQGAGSGEGPNPG